MARSITSPGRNLAVHHPQRSDMGREKEPVLRVPATFAEWQVYLRAIEVFFLRNRHLKVVEIKMPRGVDQRVQFCWRRNFGPSPRVRSAAVRWVLRLRAGFAADLDGSTQIAGCRAFKQSATPAPRARGPLSCPLKHWEYYCLPCCREQPNSGRRVFSFVFQSHHSLRQRREFSVPASVFFFLRQF